MVLDQLVDVKHQHIHEDRKHAWKMEGETKRKVEDEIHARVVEKG